MAKPFANSGDPDQILHSVVSDLGLLHLSITLLRVSRLEWVNFPSEKFYSKRKEQDLKASLSGPNIFTYVLRLLCIIQTVNNIISRTNCTNKQMIWAQLFKASLA